MATFMNNLFTDSNHNSSVFNEKLDRVIAFYNPKSGGQKGEIIHEKLKKYLKHENIYDLTKSGPKPGLEKHKDTKDLRIIACGGDGTVGWVLSVIDEISFIHQPSVAIIPLGTGNDLARSLHWGGGYNNESTKEILKKVISGEIKKLDRWSITTPINENAIKDMQSDAKIKLPLKVMNNYFSIGSDAKIALDFHLAREKSPEKFTNQAINKLKYVEMYGRDLTLLSCKNLRNEIDLFECDGKDMLKKLREHDWHSILFLNISNYSGGQTPWKNDSHGQQSFSDGQLEIIGFHTMDLMLLQMGRPGDRIGQAREIRIRTIKRLPMQIDGEPVLIEPVDINIKILNKANMIDAKNHH